MVIAIAVALALASSDAASNAAVLPSGTYRYAINNEGSSAKASTIVVKRHNGSLQIAESTKLSDDPISTTRTLDPSTFSTLDYAVMAQDETDTIDIAGEDRNPSQWSEFDDANAGDGWSFDRLPLLGGRVRRDAGDDPCRFREHINVYCVCFYGFEVKPATIVPTTSLRPAGVPATDAEAAFDLDEGIVTLWYDPATFVLRELDVPKVRFISS